MARSLDPAPELYAFLGEESLSTPAVTEAAAEVDALTATRH